MKIVFTSFVLYLLVSSCTTHIPTQLHLSNSQCAFDSIIDTYHKKQSGNFNKIVEEELFDEYNKALTAFFDTTKVEKWDLLLQGLDVSDITIKDTLYHRIKFNLINGLEAMPKITFEATYYSKAENCNMDSVYQELKAIGNLEKVFFSGNIIKSGNLVLGDSSLGNGFQISYPTFHILITDIDKYNEEKY